MDNDSRRAEFVAAANELYREQGIRHTSILDIAQRVGVTRSLFYHYFPDKQAVTDAVIEMRINEFMAYVREWTSQLDGVDIQEALKRLSGMARSFLRGPDSFISCAARDQDHYLTRRFVVRGSSLLADYFVRTRNENGSPVRLTNARHPREAFYVLSVGIMSIMTQDPEVSDDVIADLIIDTLHISRKAVRYKK